MLGVMKFSMLALALSTGGTPAMSGEFGQETAPTVDPSGYQVARPGDTQLSCEALAAEIVLVERELAEMQAATDRVIAGMRPRSRVMPGQREAAVANSIGGAVIPGGSIIVAAGTHQAVMAAREGREQQAMNVLGEHIQGQSRSKELVFSRFDHLLRISERKRCGIVPASLQGLSMGDAPPSSGG
ncbi:hypothetical protein ACIQC9_01725 [Brevundimonas sp. NPDC092305]|uniref:hypothetical protein n=1 Tax=Brevundimonas sp. NPDC092305 TaxID=3363957 RepID=UPI0037FFB2A0